MTKATYPTDDGGAIHEYVKDTVQTKTEITTEITTELEECVPDGINIHITGSEINRISNIDIYMKEEE